MFLSYFYKGRKKWGLKECSNKQFFPHQVQFFLGAKSVLVVMGRSGEEEVNRFKILKNKYKMFFFSPVYLCLQGMLHVVLLIR